VLRAAVEEGRTPTVVTFNPHPRAVLGSGTRLLTTLERRVELLTALGAEDTLIVPFTRELAALEPAEFAESYLLAIGAEVVVAGSGFRFGRERSGDLDLLESLGLEVRTVPLVDDVSSTRIRDLVHTGAVVEAAALLGRPFELDGTVARGDERGRTLGFPTANLDVAPDQLVPPLGIYAGAAAGARAAVSIGVNPQYGGTERRIEAYLLDWSGDLYGQRLVVEVWRRLRDEQTFPSEDALVQQIARDVEATRIAVRPA
jgi:riboflavin kinase/FMN adenylyltransferase